MAYLEIKLKDKNGKKVQIGDRLKVWLPEINIDEIDGYLGHEPIYGSVFWVDVRQVEALLWFQPSRGLILKIKWVSDYEGDSGKDGKPFTRVGQTIPFKTKAWKFEKIGEREKPFDLVIKDDRHNSCIVGNTLLVTLPKMCVRWDTPLDKKEYAPLSIYAQPRVVEASLSCLLARGLVIKVIRVVRDCPQYPGYLKVGKIIKFPYRRKEWSWAKHNVPKGCFDIELDCKRIPMVGKPLRLVLPKAFDIELEETVQDAWDDEEIPF